MNPHALDWLITGLMAFALGLVLGSIWHAAHGTELIVPGVVNPDVTQANINDTICKHGWTATIRPPLAYTNTLKHQQMVRLGLPGQLIDYEEDHFIPLELGGHPNNPNNLWPQIWDVKDACSAHVKDIDENAFNDKVCKGQMTLKQAQQAISDKWLHCKRP
jgi:hypothetical protein